MTDPDAPRQNDPHPQAELHGHIERITFHAEESGFTVAKVRTKGNRHSITVVGTMLEPRPGQSIAVRGEWRDDPRWGEQFKATSCECTLPATAEGLRLYLQSSLIKGVGPKHADAIVDHFGAEALDVLENDPDRLLEVPGIGKKRLKIIKTSWDEHREIRELMLFLQSHGVSAGLAVRLYRHYGPEALTVVRTNPYRPAMDMAGIGFLTADAMAAKLGFDRDCDLRAEAGVLWVMQQTMDSGHVCFPYAELVERGREVLEVETEAVEDAIANMAREDRLVVEDMDQVRSVYLKGLHTAEKGVAERLARLASAPKTVRPLEVDAAVDWVQKEESITLAPGQVQAVRQAASSKVMVVTGGPGTGKTTIIKAMVRIFTAMRAKVLLAAPTGRAAKRMSEATGHTAKTIHRLLEYSPKQQAFQRNEDNPLTCGLLVVDEASMIDVGLMYHLLGAIPLGATLILVGDVNQLPSVGPGSVLGDFIESGAVPVIRLTEIFRQARESSIIMSAHAINEGRVPYLESTKEVLSDFYFIRQEEPEAALAMIVDLVKNHIPRRFGLDPVEDIQVLSPMHRGVVGAENLGARLQEALNPSGVEIVRGGRRYRLGDKVMQIRNDYDKDVFNGDIGRICALDVDARELLVRYDDREVGYEFAELDEVVPAYAVSVHKSQGSEYPAVVVPVMTQHFVMLQRNLIYTAVTRGQKLVVLVGTKKALSIAVRNKVIRERHSHLAERLSKE